MQGIMAPLFFAGTGYISYWHNRTVMNFYRLVVPCRPTPGDTHGVLIFTKTRWFLREETRRAVCFDRWGRIGAGDIFGARLMMIDERKSTAPRCVFTRSRFYGVALEFGEPREYVWIGNAIWIFEGCLGNLWRREKVVAFEVDAGYRRVLKQIFFYLKREVRTTCWNIIVFHMFYMKQLKQRLFF